MRGAGRGFGVLLIVSGLLGFVAVGPEGGGLAAGPGGTGGGPGGPTAPGADDPTRVVGPDGVPGPDDPRRPGETPGRQPRSGLTCSRAGNGGPTDDGVSAGEIKIATTAVLDGVAASLLSSSPTAMRAVINKVNSTGGICGRQLKLTVVNDGFDANRGSGFLRNFIDAKYFALPVVPSAEGLSLTITGGYIGRAGIPVVGTDGMRIDQYGSEWVWPVATATASTMRIMAKHGFEKAGARKFALVYDSSYQFGIEGRDAFIDQVKKLGGQLVTAVGLNPQKTSYGSEVDSFNRACEGGCDMVAMLLLPDAARQWMAAGPKKATLYTAAAQTLFSQNFAQQCARVAGDNCHGIAVWTGYNPPIGSLAELPGLRTYIDDVRAVDPRIDVQNQFVQGAYLGMTLFVEALRKVGPDLTREALRDVLDNMTLQTDLAPTLTWRRGQHHANGHARAFSMVISQGTFTGWRDDLTGFVKDPGLGAR